MDARRYILAVLIAAIAALGAGLLVLELAGVYTVGLMRDVTATAELAPWTGFFSTLGLLVWAAAAGACLLTGGVLLRGDRRAWFFLATAALLVLLALDDAYLVHEEIAPERLGISERGVYALLGTATLVWAARFRHEIARSDRWLLAVAMIAFGASLTTDFASDELIVVEDWLKLSGILAFAVWCFSGALEALDRRAATATAERAGRAVAVSDHVPLAAHRAPRGERPHVRERRPT